MLTQNYALAFEHALASGTGLSAALATSPLATRRTWKNFPTTVTVPNSGGTSFTSSLMAQLKMVGADH